MKTITTATKEYIVSVLIVVSFITYYFDLLHDGMMTSGVIALVLTVYIGIIWQEKVHDERDEYIRAKVDRILYISTLVLLLIDIIHKTFAHTSYMSEIIILTVLSLVKVVLSKIIKESH
jgi:hypothetical protein